MSGMLKVASRARRRRRRMGMAMAPVERMGKERTMSGE
jgi:hypothetical protein